MTPKSGRNILAGLMIQVLVLLMAALPSPESALDLIEIPWKQLGYEIVFKPPRAGYRAMTFAGKKSIEVYARPQDDLDLMAYDIAHEIGHVVDLTYNTPETRKAWMKMRGINPATDWFGCSRCSDYNTPAGDFAETFALYLRGPKYFRSRIAPRPTPEALAVLSRFFPDKLLRKAPVTAPVSAPVTAPITTTATAN